MSVVVPSWVNDLMLVVVGERFLQADEDLAHASADPYGVLAAQVLRVADELERSAVATGRSLPEGVAGEYLGLAFELVRVLREWAGELYAVAEGRGGTSLDIVESKREMLAELAWLALCLGILAAVAFFSAGGSTGLGQVLIAKCRVDLLVVGAWLAKRTRLAPMVSEAIEEVLMALLVRASLVVGGWKGLRRKGVDGKSIGVAALVGALAAFGQQVLSGAGKQLKKALGLATTKPALKPPTGSLNHLTPPWARPKGGTGTQPPTTPTTGPGGGSGGGLVAAGRKHPLTVTLMLGAGVGAGLFVVSAVSESSAEAFVEVTVNGNDNGWNWT
ncbi:hypothetical protein ACIOWI_36090, partial [Streptomyces sp. NPDC087659]